MDLTGPLQLAPGTDLFPATDIEPAARERIGCADDDFVLSRAGSRSGTSIVEPQLAYLLSLLQQPTRIVDAVVALSSRFGVDPRATLDAVLPSLLGLIDDGYVVDASVRRRLRRESLGSGTRVGGWVVTNALHKMDDSEVYQVARDGRFGALKIGVSRSRLGRRNVLNERAVLGRLNLPTVPRVCDHGVFDGRVYLVTEWRPGSDVGLAARELRGMEPDRRRPAQIALCESIATAYADLHDAHVVHGDVHEGNLLVDAQGQLSILDFGIARDIDNPASTPPRGAVGVAWEPEYASAVLSGRPSPPATLSGEQFILASLLFELVTGAPYTDFSYESTRALRQVLSDPPRSFAECGVGPWPELETVLARAMAKDVGDRFPSMRAFARSLRELRSTCSRATRKRTDSTRRNTSLDRWIMELAAFAGVPSAGTARAPTASFAYGAAGVAYMLLRLARQEGSAPLLAAADVWAEHAMYAMRHDGEEAFGDREMSSASVGPSSLYFSAPGVHTVRALVGAAGGRMAPLRSATRALARSAAKREHGLDLGLGQPGLLLACTLILEGMPPWSSASRQSLMTLGNAIASQLDEDLARLPAIAHATELRNLGVAHGWAGLLYAALRWSQTTGAPLPNAIHDRCDELAALGVPAGRGVRFPWRTEMDERPSDDQYMSGWCNGSAGFVHMWLAAGDALDRPRYFELAEACAWQAWEDDTDDASLCCGFSGRAYALLAWYRRSRDGTWRARATDLVNRGIGGLSFDGPLDASLLKGHLSLALLQRELARPRFARMPLFEPDAWPARWRASR